MRSARFVWIGSAVTCGALAVACADSLSPGIAAVDDLFAELDNAWSVSTNPVSVSPGVTHLTTRPAAVSCAYDVSDARFRCPTRVQNGLTSTTSYQLDDESGMPQPGFVRHSTASIHLVTDVDGFLPSVPGVSTTLVAHADEIMSGLASGLHTLNATAASTFTTTGTMVATFSSVETTLNLKLASRDQATPYPTSGTITTLLYAGPVAAAAALLSTVTATFNGTPNVSLVIVTGSLTQSCTVDLKSAAALTCQ